MGGSPADCAEDQPQDNPESCLNNSQSKELPGFGVAWNGIQNTMVFADTHNGFDARLGANRVSEQYADGANTTAEVDSVQDGTIPSRIVFDAAMNFRQQGSKTSYFPSTCNLTDREYLVSRVDAELAGRERLVIAGIRYAF